VWTKISVSILLACAACGTDAADTAPSTYAFGPFTLTPGQELTDLCVSATLHNEAPIYVNSIDMAGATGIHHSNWFWVPDSESFVGPDGSWSCSEHNYDQAAAALFGGVLFAQSTQATQEEQSGEKQKAPMGLQDHGTTDHGTGVGGANTEHPTSNIQHRTVLEEERAAVRGMLCKLAESAPAGAAVSTGKHGRRMRVPPMGGRYG